MLNIKKYSRTFRPNKQQFYHYFYNDVKRIKKNGWVLDMGAQACKNYDILKEFRYIAADISFQILKKCPQEGIYKVVTDILNPGFRKDAFDAVVCTHTLSHLNFEKRPKALQNIKLLVKPGGFLIFNIPLAEKNKERKKKTGKITLEELKNYLASDFIIERQIKYRGIISRFYEATVFNFFTKIKKRNRYVTGIFLCLAYLVFLLEYLTKLHKIGSNMAYFCLRKKSPQQPYSKSEDSNDADDDITDKLACPSDLAELEYISNQTGLKCKKCGRIYQIEDKIIILT